MDIREATSTVFPMLPCTLPSLCLNNAMVFPPPVGPHLLTPTLLFSGKEPTAHFLNLLGLPVTEPHPQGYLSERWGESGITCKNTEHQPMLSIREDVQGLPTTLLNRDQNWRQQWTSQIQPLPPGADILMGRDSITQTKA